MHQIALPELEAVVSLTLCEVPPPDPVVTTVAPVREHQSLYLATGNRMYVVHADDGRAQHGIIPSRPSSPDSYRASRLTCYSDHLFS